MRVTQVLLLSTIIGELSVLSLKLGDIYHIR